MTCHNTVLIVLPTFCTAPTATMAMSAHQQAVLEQVLAFVAADQCADACRQAIHVVARISFGERMHEPCARSPNRLVLRARITEC